ncbi:MAG TPA: phosphatase PAP2 family protein [Bacteroidales bacterium]|nr:phosphatase PAP2 family protein [Bacteroidales bacterium]
MIEQLEHLDQQLFLFFNSLHCSFLDPVMYALSGKLIWVPLYLAILIYLAVRDKKKFFFFLLFVAFSVILADRGSGIIKNIVERFRPCHEPDIEELVHIVNGYCGGMYGFFSSHAANAFNVAFISLLAIRKRWYTISIIIWALIVGYTRIYLGVHYPGDILCGSIYGSFTGWFSFRMYEYFQNR